MPFTMTKLNINKAFFTTLIKGQRGDKLPVIQKPSLLQLHPIVQGFFFLDLQFIRLGRQNFWNYLTVQIFGDYHMK